MKLSKDGFEFCELSKEPLLGQENRNACPLIKVEETNKNSLRRGGGAKITYGFGETIWGKTLLAKTHLGLCFLGFPDDHEKGFDDLRSRWQGAEYRKSSEAWTLWGDRVSSYHQGESEDRLELHLMGSSFQLKVWQALLDIPKGYVTTYADVAKMTGMSSATRAVSSAIGRNPISYLIPCHRVISSDGNLNRYHWGEDRKRSMLLEENKAKGNRRE